LSEELRQQLNAKREAKLNALHAVKEAERTSKKESEEFTFRVRELEEKRRAAEAELVRLREEWNRNAQELHTRMEEAKLAKEVSELEKLQLQEELLKLRTDTIGREEHDKELGKTVEEMEKMRAAYVGRVMELEMSLQNVSGEKTQAEEQKRQLEEELEKVRAEYVGRVMELEVKVREVEKERETVRSEYVGRVMELEAALSAAERQRDEVRF
jgi:sporulation protein YlmC with PRC-barrel domain